MFNLSENYQLRKCFLQRDQVPTQTLIKKKMTPPLANIYFKTMSPKLKVVAGLEPPLQGGGNDWIVHPEELLQGNTVLKPLKKEYMSQWGWEGLDGVGMKLVQIHRDRMLVQRDRVLIQHDLSWQEAVNKICCHELEKCTDAAAEANTKYLNHVVLQFEIVYKTSINKMQAILFDAAVDKIKASREEAFKKMQDRYEDLLKRQATMLYDRYTNKLMNKQNKMKSKFLHNLELAGTELGQRLHDINVEKHLIVEKLRHFLECQALACQAYVAMKERLECAREMETTKQEHAKKTNIMIEDIKYKDFEILLADMKEQKHLEFETMWKKKVCRVVKQFQTFVLYCLNTLPEHAEFFINMEKLMLLQLSEALENPKVDSIIIMEVAPFRTPIPRPHPFYLFCDKGFKPRLNQDLCPKHCTSSASHLPVIVIDKRFIYAACDNFEQFTDKIKDFVHGKLLEDAVFQDYHDYSIDVPVKYTPSIQLQELRLADSLLQVLQQEIANARDLPVVCRGCNIPHCFYCSRSSSSLGSQKSIHSIKEEVKPPTPVPLISSGFKITSREDELVLEREPKWQSYMEYVKTKKCDCGKIAKKHLMENLPVYMRNMSKYEQPQLLNYEVCSLTSMKTLVKKAKGKVTPPPPTRVPSKTKEKATQCSDDEEFDYLCTCFSDDSTLNVLTGAHQWSKLSNLSSNMEFRLMGASMSSTHLTKEAESFATEAAKSLKVIVDESPGVKDIFSRKDCTFD